MALRRHHATARGWRLSDLKPKLRHQSCFMSSRPSATPVRSGAIPAGPGRESRSTRSGDGWWIENAADPFEHLRDWEAISLKDDYLVASFEGSRCIATVWRRRATCATMIFSG